MNAVFGGLQDFTVITLVMGTCISVAILAMFFDDIRLKIKDRVTIEFRKESKAAPSRVEDSDSTPALGEQAPHLILDQKGPHTSVESKHKTPSRTELDSKEQ